MVELVGCLAGRNYDVQLLTYFDQYDHFLQDVLSRGVNPESITSKRKTARSIAIRRWIRKQECDCVISFLTTPNLMAIFSSIGFPRIPVIVSERSLDLEKPSITRRFSLKSYRFADRIVVNSRAQKEFIDGHFPGLAKKTQVIVNCVDLQRFCPSDNNTFEHNTIVVPASHRPVKNSLALIRALDIANRQLDSPITIDWYGDRHIKDGMPTNNSKHYLEARQLVSDLQIDRFFRFFDPAVDLHEKLPQYSALCLPSLYEGCPNTVCEAMASGIPVLASRISDLPDAIANNQLLFNPSDVNSIAETLIHFGQTSPSDRRSIGTRNRTHAEQNYSPEVFSNRFCDLIHEIA